MITQVSASTSTKDPLTTGDACGGRSHRKIIATIVNESDYRHDCQAEDVVYFFQKCFRGALLAINELPVTEETLWFRLLGRGTVQLILLKIIM